MPGTKAGYIKTRQAMIAKYGSEEAFKEHLKGIGSKGGKNGKGPNYKGGFSSATPEQRRAWGKIGGSISRRSKAGQQTKVTEYAIPTAYQDAA